MKSLVGNFQKKTPSNYVLRLRVSDKYYSDQLFRKISSPTLKNSIHGCKLCKKILKIENSNNDNLLLMIND